MPFDVKKPIRYTEERSEEEIACRRKLTSEMLKAEPSLSSVAEAAKALLVFRKDDAIGAFCLSSIDGDAEHAVDCLLRMDALDNTELRAVILFALRVMKKEYVGILKALIDRGMNGEEQTAFFTRIEAEAETIDDTVYISSLPRDVYIAFSPHDAPVAAKVTAYLENQGFSCFFGLRNLRRGADAKSSDLPDILSAMENCKAAVFVSSENSRSLTCNALRIELPYILKNRPDMKRAELLLDDGGKKEKNTASAFLKDFFAGKKPCKTLDALATFLWREVRGVDTDAKSCESVYRQALGILEKKRNKNSLSAALALFDSIRGYKDTELQIGIFSAELDRIEMAEAEKTILFSGRHKKILQAVRTVENMRGTPGAEELQDAGKDKLSGIEAVRYAKKADADKQRIFYLKTRKLRFRLYAFAVSICLILAVIFSAKYYFVPKSRYNEAMRYLSSEDYANAIPAFRKLGDFSDSEEKLRSAIMSAYRSSSEGDGYFRFGDYLLFGLYPQSTVTDSDILARLNGQAGDSDAFSSYNYSANGLPGDYMRYIDVTDGEDKYRGVTFSSYRPKTLDAASTADESYQDENGFAPGEIYWFRFEPIVWRILKTENENRVLCLCESIIDAREFDGESNFYPESSIRRWLNEAFFATAFSEAESRKIVSLAVENGERSTNPKNNAGQWQDGNNPQAGENTLDAVFLLSVYEATDDACGFAADLSAYDGARQKVVTDYAKCQGKPASFGAVSGCGWWWLRSPDCRNTTAAHQVYSQGYADGCTTIFSTAGGVVPALWLDLH